jgi:exopolyphosphatase/guanosine-5'-triphosphate,3'-diphosphate pyrophosphatase
MTCRIPLEDATLLLPTAILIRKFVSFTGVRTIELPVATLADGLLLELARQEGTLILGHNPQADMIAVARQMVRHYHADRRHSSFVEQTADQLFEATRRLHRLGARQRLLLQLAALLHDTGKFISLDKPNHRSFQMILASELIGLSDEERYQVAWIARFYTGPVSCQEKGLEDLKPAARLEVFKLAAILRLADALDATHRQTVTLNEITVDEQNLILTVSSTEDLTLVQWSFEQKTHLFQAVYGVDPRIRVRRR